jgi:hypothetical protein
MEANDAGINRKSVVIGRKGDGAVFSTAKRNKKITKS